VADGELDVRRGTVGEPDAVLATTPAVFAALAWHGRPLADAVRTTEVNTEGSTKALQRLLGLFNQPACPGESGRGRPNHRRTHERSTAQLA
jgi:hypothetical protein